MLKLKTTRKFDKELIRLVKGGKDIQKIKKIMTRLAKGENLDRKHRDHRLKGEFKGRRECHIEPDWLLIYKKEADAIILERTGSHSELFK